MVEGTLVDMIEARADADGNWHMTVNELIDALQIDIPDIYRRLYERRDMLDTIAPVSFGPDNVFALIAAVYDDLAVGEAALARRGIYLTVDARSELADRYVSAVCEDADRHRIRSDDFTAMRRRFGDGPQTVQRYLEHYFDLDSYIEPVIDQFLESRPEMIPRIARRACRDALRLLFVRNVLSPETLLQSVIIRLRRELPGAEAAASPQYDPELRASLDDLGLSHVPSTIDELKRIYRTLMKTYHPDVNPQGLRLSQRITRAYTFVSAALRGHAT